MQLLRIYEFVLYICAALITHLAILFTPRSFKFVSSVALGVDVNYRILV